MNTTQMLAMGILINILIGLIASPATATNSNIVLFGINLTGPLQDFVNWSQDIRSQTKDNTINTGIVNSILFSLEAAINSVLFLMTILKMLAIGMITPLTLIGHAKTATETTIFTLIGMIFTMINAMIVIQMYDKIRGLIPK